MLYKKNSQKILYYSRRKYIYTIIRYKMYIRLNLIYFFDIKTNVMNKIHKHKHNKNTLINSINNIEKIEVNIILIIF